MNWFENQFLHAPIQEFRYIKLVFGWTCDFVDPSELLELLAGFAQHAQDFAVETEFVDSSGKSIRAV